MPSDLSPIVQLHDAGAPQFVTTDAAKILNDLKIYFEEETGRTLSPSQVEMYLFEAAAYMLAIAAAENQTGFKNTFVAWADDAFLEAHGADRNVRRLAATPATTTLRFFCSEPAISPIHIPAGSRVSDPANQVQFQTLQAAVIALGSSEVVIPARSIEAGSYANGFPVGSISEIIDPIPGLNGVENISVSGNGAEIEDINRYRTRVALAFEGIGDGLSKERYESDVLGWSARCVDVEITRPAPGHVNIYPLMDSGAPNPEELNALRGVFDASNIHQGDFIQIMEPTPLDFSLTLALTLSFSEVESAAISAVQSVLDGWSKVLGGYIAPSELIRAAKSIDGVVEADVSGVAFTAVDPIAWRRGTIQNVVVEVVF